MGFMLDDDIREDLEKVSGKKWAKLAKKGDRLEGELRGVEKKVRLNLEDEIVYKRGTSEPRHIYRVVVEVPEAEREGPDDDGLRNWDANEVGQSAFKAAYRPVKHLDLDGAHISIVVTKEAPNAMSWAEYKVKIEPRTANSNIKIDADEPDADDVL